MDGGQTHRDDIRMVQLLQEFDLAQGRHVETILERAHFDLLDRD